MVYQLGMRYIDREIGLSTGNSVYQPGIRDIDSKRRISTAKCGISTNRDTRLKKRFNQGAALPD
ncbi:hypothetical protein J2Z82_002327 [Virgibacillus litoralis]|uniref:Uncharacterized protein n=1 Tax=Virgibacillus litoralis TaxID=578221 RepID=A0ABS4HEM6_9BACI|nr:hypothetical protein [Virgibacillus litoralis]